MTEQAPIRLYDSVTSPNCHRVKVVLEDILRERICLIF